jgi:hypothetical protein
MDHPAFLIDRLVYLWTHMLPYLYTYNLKDQFNASTACICLHESSDDSWSIASQSEGINALDKLVQFSMVKCIENVLEG